MERSDLQRIDDFQWELPASYRSEMRVPVRFFASEALLDAVTENEAAQQAINVSSLPGVVGHVVVMPDAYAGEGAPFGMVAATKYPVGIVAPGAIGHDINSGVRLLGSDIKVDDIADRLDELADKLEEHIPVGPDAESPLSISKSEVDHIAKSGAQWALRKNMAEQEDLVRTEEGGRLNEANPDRVSDEARALGAQQLGTLGGGEHFIEVNVVDDLMHQAAGFTLGMHEGTLAVQIHCGSRGYGQQICADYIATFYEKSEALGIDLPDPQLACVPLEERSAEHYLGAMRAAANYAYANRQVLAHLVREAVQEVLGEEAGTLHTVYDVAHTLGHVEMHEVNGRHMRCFVHRKGATRAFGPGTPGISLPYRALGQPVLVPGQRGKTSWVLLGTLDSMQRSFGSACHGAGRLMSRHETQERAGTSIDPKLKEEGLRVRSGGEAAPAGEAVQVNKQLDVDEVVEVVVGARLASKVARLRPLAVVHA